MNKSLARLKSPFYQGFLTGVVTYINLSDSYRLSTPQHLSSLVVKHLLVYIAKCYIFYSLVNFN